MPAARRPENTPAPLFWFTVVFLVLVAFTGGSSRVDVPTLLVLRPVAVLACTLALISLRREHLSGRAALVAGFVAIFGLVLVHQIPLPPAVWHALPGRQDIVQTDALVGLSGQWRPFTLTPNNAWHSLASLAVPFAVLLTAAQLSRDDLLRLVPVVIVLGALSGFVGLLQATGAQGRLLDPYNVRFERGAGGLFANRNHAALLLAMLFPLLAVWLQLNSRDPARARRTVWGALILAAVLAPLVLVTGSRSGLLLAGLGLVGAAVLVRRGSFPALPQFSRQRKVIVAASTVGAILVLGLMTLYFSRAEALTRLFDRGTIEDSRFESWPVSQALLTKYFPMGSGAGSFVETYQIIEPDSQLNPTYWNHAHNDFLETAITFGMPGVLLLLVTAAFFLRRAWSVWRDSRASSRTVAVARVATILVVMMALASITDYPLRTPFMMSIMALCALWIVEPARSRMATSAAGSTPVGERVP